MAFHSRVVWTEGMFLKPHHFQQHDRFIERIIEARSRDLRSGSWGVSELKIDQKALEIGRIAVAHCRAVLPDGTVLDIPGEDEPPLPLEIPEGVADGIVYIALPIYRPGVPESRYPDQDASLARYQVAELAVRDAMAGSDSSADVQVGTPALRLLTASRSLEEYASIGIARVVERRGDGKLVLDDEFIPTCLDCRASPCLLGYVKEVLGLLHHRGEALAGRLGQADQGGVGEVLDFLLLQLVNRYEPLMAHLEGLCPLHPEVFYRYAIQLAGELAGFTRPERRSMEFPTYRHHQLDETFAPVMKELRRAFSAVLEQRAIAIQLEEREYGIHVATIPDPNLLRSADFVLAVHTTLPATQLQQRFPKQTKIGPVEEIANLVNNLLPGLVLTVLPAAPREIPWHAGFSYFLMDRSGEYWQRLESSGGLAIHLSGDFPSLKMELWAIKR